MISMQFSDGNRQLRNFDLSLEREKGIYNHEMDLNQIGQYFANYNPAGDKKNDEDDNKEIVERKVSMEGVINKVSLSSFDSHCFSSDESV